MSGDIRGKQIVTHLPTRDNFFQLLQANPGLVIIKLGATWCGPCKRIKDHVHRFFASSPDNVVCLDLDVDECVDFYSFLKSKRMVNGIPVMLCYKKGNKTGIPDDSVTGADSMALTAFFRRCGSHLVSVDM